MVDVVDGGLEGRFVVVEGLHHGGGEFPLGELGERTEEEEIEFVGPAGLRVAAGDDREGREKGRGQGEGREDDEGQGYFFGGGPTEDDGEDEEGRGDEDAGLLIGHAAQLDVVLLNRAKELNSRVAQGGAADFRHGEKA